MTDAAPIREAESEHNNKRRPPGKKNHPRHQGRNNPADDGNYEIDFGLAGEDEDVYTKTKSDRAGHSDSRGGKSGGNARPEKRKGKDGANGAKQGHQENRNAKPRNDAGEWVVKQGQEDYKSSHQTSRHEGQHGNKTYSGAS